MDRFIASRNIDHYRLLLAGDLDPDQRRLVETLLGEEEEKFRLAPPDLPPVGRGPERDPPRPPGR
jgi:hypothetical protein